MSMGLKTPALVPNGVAEPARVIFDLVQGYGGFVNAHAHIDRAFTTGKKYLAHCGRNPLDAVSLSLEQKQVLMGELHDGPAYQDPDDLSGRMELAVLQQIDHGVRELVSFIDVTPDIGFRALDAAKKIRETYREKIVFRIATHPIFGFKKDGKHEISRWDLFKQACMMKEVEIIGALAEKDDRADSVGWDSHTRRVLELGLALNKDVHMHLGQANDPNQHDVLDAIQFVRCFVGEPQSVEDPPKVWFIHAISPSAYSERTFMKVLEGLVRYNIGVIVCPKAAVTMLQLRSIVSPTHACIARVLEMALFGAKVRLGTDNIADMFIPFSSGRMIDEVVTLAENIRFSSPSVLAKLAAGRDLNFSDKDAIKEHLRHYNTSLVRANPDFKFCMPSD